MKAKKLLGAGALAGAALAGGMLAPQSWQAAVKQKLGVAAPAADAQQKPGAAQPQGAAPKVAAAGTAKKSDSKTGGAKPTDAKKKDAPKPVDIFTTRRPLSLGKGQHLGLSLGLYVGEAASQPMAARVQALGYKTATVAVEDENKQVWTLLVAGKYDNDAEAERQQAILADYLHPAPEPEIVLIPPPPKKK